MLDMMNSSPEILILNPKEALGILDLRSTTINLDQVWAMISFADDGGREPQVPGVIEGR